MEMLLAMALLWIQTLNLGDFPIACLRMRTTSSVSQGLPISAAVSTTEANETEAHCGGLLANGGANGTETRGGGLRANENETGTHGAANGRSESGRARNPWRCCTVGQCGAGICECQACNLPTNVPRACLRLI